jgi:hypothetical protein
MFVQAGICRRVSERTADDCSVLAILFSAFVKITQKDCFRRRRTLPALRYEPFSATEAKYPASSLAGGGNHEAQKISDLPQSRRQHRWRRILRLRQEYFSVPRNRRSRGLLYCQVWQQFKRFPDCLCFSANETIPLQPFYEFIRYWRKNLTNLFLPDAPLQ